MLSGVANTEFPHVFAAREEMRHWRFLHLNPEVLRQPSPMLANQFVLPDGSNLPSARPHGGGRPFLARRRSA